MNDPAGWAKTPPGGLPPDDRESLGDAGFETLCAHHADRRQAHVGAAVPPIYQVSTFMYPNAEAFEQHGQEGTPHYGYTRCRNPTTEVLEAKIARLENGTWARACASGMGAITGAINACVHAGAHVVAVAQCYWPTQQYLHDYLTRFGVETTFVKSCDAADFLAAVRENTKLIYLESPTSGDFRILDIAPITAAARQRGIPTIFDNSWATPYFQRPLELGCDLVVHSATKYIGGHSDVVAGLIVGRDDDLRRRIVRETELLGATLDPFAAWLLVRGLRTLALRMERHQQSAMEVARFLAGHPKVARVHHPGLPSHPQHELARRQMRGFASLFSFELKEPTRVPTQRCLNRLRIFSLGVSWGGHESLALGGDFFGHEPGGPWLIRLHVGLETIDDLIADLRQALED